MASRLIRLYVPIWGALILGLLVQALIRAQGELVGSQWLVIHDVELTLRDLIRDIVVVDGTTNVNSSIWPMQYEIIFSLLLPIVLVVTMWAGRRWARISILLVLIPIVMFASTNALTSFLGMFLAGAVLAEIAIPRIPGIFAIPVALLGLALFSTRFTLPFVAEGPAVRTDWIPLAAVTAASMIFIVLAIGNKATGWLLTTPVPQYIGVRAYSVYLVQAPIIVAVAVGLTALTETPEVSVWWSLLAVGAALATGAVFYQYVEKPSYALARRVRVRLSNTDAPPNGDSALINKG